MLPDRGHVVCLDLFRDVAVCAEHRRGVSMAGDQVRKMDEFWGVIGDVSHVCGIALFVWACYEAVNRYVVKKIREYMGLE